MGTTAFQKPEFLQELTKHSKCDERPEGCAANEALFAPGMTEILMPSFTTKQRLSKQRRRSRKRKQLQPETSGTL
jgi:hypothetical protein